MIQAQREQNREDKKRKREQEDQEIRAGIPEADALLSYGDDSSEYKKARRDRRRLERVDKACLEKAKCRQIGETSTASSPRSPITSI